MNKKYQFQITIEASNEQNDLILQIGKFIAQRPVLSSTNEFKETMMQINNITKIQNVNLTMVQDYDNPNGKLLIILRKLTLNQFIVPKQQSIQITFDCCSIKKIDYSQTQLTCLSKINIYYGYIQEVIVSQQCNSIQSYSFMHPIKLVFPYVNRIEKIKLSSHSTIDILIENKLQRNFLDLSQFTNLKSISIKRLKTDILLPDNNIRFLLLEKEINNPTILNILNSNIIAKVVELIGFDLQNTKLQECSSVACFNCRFIQYTFKHNIRYNFNSNQIDILTIKTKTRNLQLNQNQINTLILPNNDIEHLEVGNICNIVIGEYTKNERNKIPTQIDLSQLTNLKSITIYYLYQPNIIFPIQIQCIKIISVYSHKDHIRNIDLSYLYQLQNLTITNHKLTNIIMHQGKLKMGFNTKVSSGYVKIQVKDLLSNQFDFQQFLNNIEELEFKGLEQIIIQDHQNDTIDCSAFKNLKIIKTDSSPNIKITNQSYLLSAD